MTCWVIIGGRTFELRFEDERGWKLLREAIRARSEPRCW